MIKELICTNCPMGCLLKVEYENGKVLSVSGNTCKNGATFGTNEVLCPKRTLTSVVKIKNRNVMLSVKTESEVPKDKIFQLMKIINQISVTAPIRCGDVVAENIGNTGVNVVATKNVK